MNDEQTTSDPNAVGNRPVGEPPPDPAPMAPTAGSACGRRLWLAALDGTKIGPFPVDEEWAREFAWYRPGSGVYGIEITNYPYVPNYPWTPIKVPISAYAVYSAAVELWHASGVERHAEGHPGVPGPSGADESWDSDRAHLEAAIRALTLIHERLYLPNHHRSGRGPVTAHHIKHRLP